MHPSTRRAQPGARDLAVEQNTAARERYAEAARRQEEERLLRDGTPVPARITWALDYGGHEGPEVDLAVGTYEGNEAGDVDAWEDPDDPRLPGGGQVRLLAELTGFGIPWFYKPWVPLPIEGVICWGGRGGCETIVGDGVPVPPAKQPGQHVLPGMPAAADPEPARPRNPDPAPPRRAPARRTPAPQGEQLVLPPGRLADDERANLMAKLEQARRKHR